MFEWKQNGVIISGANDPVLSIPMVTGSDGGDYQCNVTNAAGSDNDIITITGRQLVTCAQFNEQCNVF